MKKKVTSISFECRAPTTLSENFEEFIIYKRSQGNCQATELEYRYHFKKFLGLTTNTLDINDLKQGVLKAFAKLNGKSNVTFNMTYKYLHCFFKWCVKNNRLESNPIKDLEFKKKKETPRIVDINLDIISQLINSFKLRTYSGFRNYVIILITLDVGIRPNELFNIERTDINLKSKQLKVREEISKTHEERILPLTNVVIDLIQKLIKVTPNDWDNKYVFYTVEGEKLTSAHWSHVLYRHCKKLEFKVTPYDLRHVFAINFLRNNGNIFALQRIMGHSDLNMTKRYLAMSETDLQEQHSLASPVNIFVKKNTRINKIFNEVK